MTVIKYAIIGIRPNAEILKKQLVALGKDVTVISFNGRTEDLSSFYDKEMSRMVMRRPLSLGEIGCAIGHLVAYQLFADKCDWLIVLEDDVQICEELQSLESEIGKFSSSKSLVKLNTFSEHESSLRYLGKSGRYIWRYRPFRTHAYAVNNRAMKYIVKNQKTIITTADWPVQWAFAIPFRSLIANHFQLIGVASTIEKERLPLQSEEHFHFQKFRSSKEIFKKIESSGKWGEKAVALFYVTYRFSKIWQTLFAPSILPSKIRQSLAIALCEVTPRS